MSQKQVILTLVGVGLLVGWMAHDELQTRVPSLAKIDETFSNLWGPGSVVG